jgi:hypothetical protein
MEINHGNTLGSVKQDNLMTSSLSYRSCQLSPTGC